MAETKQQDITAELPGGYKWGIARSSRHRIRPPMHLVYPGGGPQMVCSGGRALVERSGGRYCTACMAWLREYWNEDQD